MIKLIKEMVEIAHQTGCSHLASSLSCLPILKNIFEVMTKDDLFILSKGHGSLSLYAILREKGLNPNIKLCHPNIDIKNGIECSTGSLGHGLPIAVGMALAKKLKNERGKVYVVIGDGECQEGSIWESLVLADQFKLDNIEVYIDGNDYQATSKVINRAHEKIQQSFSNIVRIEKTIKGGGLTLFNGHPDWHSHSLNEEEYQKIIGELNEILSRK